MKYLSSSITSTILSLLASAAAPMAAGAGAAGAIPDFTKGGTIPEQARHDWNLGATGIRGWMYINNLETTQARQIAVTQVAPNSPADGKIVAGDVILGVAGQRFSHDPRVEFGKAVTAAEISGKLSLTRWRGGNEEEVVLDIKVLGTYGRTAPYDCPKSARILEEGCKALATRMQEENYPKAQNPITRSLNALALLASGKEEYMPMIRREAEWANQFSDDSSWWNAFPIILLAEYKIATGDDNYTAGMHRLALKTAKGQSMVGSWGHNYALPSGNLSGYGMMNVTGVPLTIALITAREAGMKDPAVDLAIERSAKLLRFYIGKGSVPYGDHHPWTQNHDDNGKNGMAGVMFNMLGEKDGAEYFSRMSVAAHGAERDCGHCGNFTNLLWAVPGVALSGPEATGIWMNEFGGRFFDLTRTWDFRFPHPGAPEPNGDSYKDWDATGGYLLAYAMPLKPFPTSVLPPYPPCRFCLSASPKSRANPIHAAWSNATCAFPSSIPCSETRSKVWIAPCSAKQSSLVFAMRTDAPAPASPTYTRCLVSRKSSLCSRPSSPPPPHPLPAARCSQMASASQDWRFSPRTTSRRASPLARITS
jgi:Family of unknown function (DUF6288)